MNDVEEWTVHNSWQAEAEAASRTIERMGRQMAAMRLALEGIAKSSSCGWGQDKAEQTLEKVRKLDLEQQKTPVLDERTGVFGGLPKGAP